MKFIRSLGILCFVAVSFLHSGCEKRLFDYRNKYLGDYNVTYTVKWWDMSGNQGSSTSAFVATVKYAKKSKNKIEFHYNNTMLEIDINKEGELMKCNHKIGKFESKDKFTFKFDTNTCGTGGLGGGATYEYIGNRK